MAERSVFEGSDAAVSSCLSRVGLTEFDGVLSGGSIDFLKSSIFTSINVVVSVKVHNVKGCIDSFEARFPVPNIGHDVEECRIVDICEFALEVCSAILDVDPSPCEDV